MTERPTLLPEPSRSSQPPRLDGTLVLRHGPTKTGTPGALASALSRTAHEDEEN